MTFRELSAEWLGYKRGMVKDSTLANYGGLLSYVVLPYFGDMEVSRFGKHDGQKFALYCLNAGRSVHYTRDNINMVRQLLEYAAEMYGLDVPVDFKVKYPTRHSDGLEGGVCTYTKDEAAKIIEYCTANLSPRNLGIILAFYTGMRIGELCGLRWGDVDFGDRIIHVRRAVNRIHCPGEASKVLIQTPKTKHSRRAIPISKTLFAPLKSMSRRMSPDCYVLTGSVRPAEPRNYRDYYYRLIVNKVHLDRCLKFHAIRHTFASRLITGGQDVKTVSELLGHSNAAVTLAVYTHSDDTAKRKCADALKYY